MVIYEFSKFKFGSLVSGVCFSLFGIWIINTDNDNDYEY